MILESLFSHWRNDFGERFCLPRLIMELTTFSIYYGTKRGISDTKLIEKCVEQVASTHNLTQKDIIDALLKDLPPTPQKTASPEKVITSPPSVRQLDSLSSFFKPNLKNYYQFRGKYVWEWGWLLWLQRNLGEKLMCLWTNTESTNHGIRFDDQKREFVVERFTLDGLHKCRNKGSRYAVGMITISTKHGNHANALIFDFEAKTLTRFEPHGATTQSYSASSLDLNISNWLINTLEGWKYFPPKYFCPIRGPQSRENWKLVTEALETRKVWGKDVKKEAGGFCAAWSLIFIHMRLKNPSFTDAEIVEHFDKMSDKELSYIIRQYAEFIVSTVDKNWITKEAKEKFKVGSYVKARSQPNSRGKILEIKQKKATVWFTSIQTGKKKILTYTPATVLLDQLIPLEKEEIPKINADIQKQYDDPTNKWKSYMIAYSNALGVKVNASDMVNVPLPNTKTNFKVGDIVDVRLGKEGITVGLIYKVTPQSYHVWVYTDRLQHAFRYKKTDPEVKLAKRGNRFLMLDVVITMNTMAPEVVKEAYKIAKKNYPY